MRNVRVHVPFRRLALLGGMLALSAVMLAGCNGKEEPAAPTPSGNSAKSGVETARSALSTMAPDAKLLLVQTAMSTSPTQTPPWAYLFGSEESNKTFIVYTQNGTVMQAGEYGTADLTPAQWKEVPGLDVWKIDSDAAYKTAREASGFKADPAQINMGMLLYVPKSQESTATAKELIWYVTLAADPSGEQTTSVLVDAQTGAVVPE